MAYADRIRPFTALNRHSRPKSPPDPYKQPYFRVNENFKLSGDISTGLPSGPVEYNSLMVECSKQALPDSSASVASGLRGRLHRLKLP